jgi:hypothetical protein
MLLGFAPSSSYGNARGGDIPVRRLIVVVKIIIIECLCRTTFAGLRLRGPQPVMILVKPSEAEYHLHDKDVC